MLDWGNISDPDGFQSIFSGFMIFIQRNIRISELVISNNYFYDTSVRLVGRIYYSCVCANIQEQWICDKIKMYSVYECVMYENQN